MRAREAAEVLRQVNEQTGRKSLRFLVGSGAEATVRYPLKGALLSAVHCFIEGVHFDLAYTNPKELGHKTLAIALSDCAAAGAQPNYALLTLALPQHTSELFVTEYFQGVRGVAKPLGVDVEGGNTVVSPQSMVIHVLMMGKASAHGPLPFEARPRDLILVTGHLGASAAGLNCLRSLGRAVMEPHREIFAPHLCPQPRVREANALLKAGVLTSLIDLSDGLATDVNLLVARSGVGAYIDEGMLPVSEATEKAGRLITANHRLWALYGAEDYELLFTVRPENVAKVERALRHHRVDCTVIGEIKPKRDGVMLRTLNGELNPFEARGWHNLVRRRK